MKRLIEINVIDNKIVLTAFFDSVVDHIYWKDSSDYKEVLEDFVAENPEYKESDLTILYSKVCLI